VVVCGVLIPFGYANEFVNTLQYLCATPPPDNDSLSPSSAENASCIDLKSLHDIPYNIKYYCNRPYERVVIAMSLMHRKLKYNSDGAIIYNFDVEKPQPETAGRYVKHSLR